MDARTMLRLEVWSENRRKMSVSDILWVIVHMFGFICRF